MHHLSFPSRQQGLLAAVACKLLCFCTPSSGAEMRRIFIPVRPTTQLFKCYDANLCSALTYAYRLN